MRVWVDLANSPHPLLFGPVVRRLEELGCVPLITVRDHAQTAELALERWPEAEVLGGPSPGGRLAKTAGMLERVRSLRSWARDREPDVCLSHNSYAQLLAARSLGIPAATAMDFEHQPANHVAFRCASRILVPAAVPLAPIRRQGARAAKLIRYEGLKEQIYLWDFKPDPEVLREIGVDRREETVLVVARTAPAGAAYHRSENPILIQMLERLVRQPDLICVVLVRHPEQRAQIDALSLPNLRLPERAVDARSLMYEADLFLGAGGTMTREAALLGVPAVTVFSGRRASVDTWLERRGALRWLHRAEELGPVAPRGGKRPDLGRMRTEGARLVELFASTTMSLGARAPRRASRLPAAGA